MVFIILVFIKQKFDEKSTNQKIYFSEGHNVFCLKKLGFSFFASQTGIEKVLPLIISFAT